MGEEKMTVEGLISDLGTMIQGARDGRGVSQRELAEALRCSESTVRRMESDAGRVHFATVARACGILELPLFAPHVLEIEKMPSN